MAIRIMLFATANGGRTHGKEQDKAKRTPKRVLKLPDLEQSKSAELNSLTSRSSLALSNSTFPYLLRIANLGARRALEQDSGLADGLNTWDSNLTHRGVAESQHREWTPSASLVAA